MSTVVDYKKFAVLYVDDEEQALKYFAKGFAKDFRILTATSVDQAIAILEDKSSAVGVLLTDQRMPAKTGVDLLARARSQWPQIVRLLITAYSDMESAIKAVNLGSIHQYITKPPNLPELKKILSEAMESYVQQQEKAVLLREKSDALHRLVVADRVRGLATMADGIAHHVRNSLTAMKCFLEDAADNPSTNSELLALAKAEQERLLEIVQKVGESVIRPDEEFGDEIELTNLLAQAVDAAKSELGNRKAAIGSIDASVKLKVNLELALRTFRTLLKYAGRLSAENSVLAISAEVIAEEGQVEIQIVSPGEAWSQSDINSMFTPFAFPSNDPSDLGLEMVMAFFIAQHHGGDIMVRGAASPGGGFIVRLAIDPASCSRSRVLEEHLLESLSAVRCVTC